MHFYTFSLISLADSEGVSNLENFCFLIISHCFVFENTSNRIYLNKTIIRFHIDAPSCNANFKATFIYELNNSRLFQKKEVSVKFKIISRKILRIFLLGRQCDIPFFYQFRDFQAYLKKMLYTKMCLTLKTHKETASFVWD